MKQVDKKTSYTVLTMLLTSAFLFWSEQAAAVCYQTNLTGMWHFSGVSGDSYYGSMTETDSCKLTLSSTGAILPGSSSCIYRDYIGKSVFPPVSGGRFTVNTACQVFGYIGFLGGGRIVIDSGTFMDKGKTVITLVGYVNLDPDIIVGMTGVKF